MENNKFNKFYIKKPVTELIEKLRSHRTTGTTLDEEWYQALKTHLSEREISPDEKESVDHILSDDFIKELETFEKQKIEVDKNKNNKSNIVINPNNIVAAGKAIKSVVYSILTMIISTLIELVIVNTSPDINVIKNTHIILGVVCFICSIIILMQLYTAGDDLENVGTTP